MKRIKKVQVVIDTFTGEGNMNIIHTSVDEFPSIIIAKRAVESYIHVLHHANMVAEAKAETERGTMAAYDRFIFESLKSIPYEEQMNREIYHDNSYDIYIYKDFWHSEEKYLHSRIYIQVIR